MESIGAIDAQESLNPRVSDQSEMAFQGGFTNARGGMSEILRFFSEEKKARGLGEKGTSTATTEQQGACEFIEAKLDATEPQCRDIGRDAEARARASYTDALRNCNRKRFSTKKFLTTSLTEPACSGRLK